MTARRRLRGAVAVLASACLGCSSVWVRDDARIDPPRSLAVLPFLPAAELRFEHAADPELLAHLGARADQLQRVIAGRLALLPYLQLPHAQVARRLKDAGLDDPRRAWEASPAALRAALGVDLIVRGVLTEDLHVPAGIIYWRSIGCRMEVLDLRYAGEVFATLERTEGDLGGLLMEMGQPVEGLEDTLDSHSELGFLRLADLLAGELAREFPRASQAPSVEPPRIASARWKLDDHPWSADARSASSGRAPTPAHTLGPGARLRLHLQGTPGQRAMLRLSGGRAVPLFEVAPGRYEGRYRASSGEHCRAPRLVLAGPFGAADVRELPLCVDARLPGRPLELLVQRRGQEVELRWGCPPRPSPTAVEVSAYVIHERTARGALRELGRVRDLEARVPARSDAAGYAVAALSATGALGDPVWVAAPAQVAADGEESPE